MHAQLPLLLIIIHIISPDRAVFEKLSVLSEKGPSGWSLQVGDGRQGPVPLCIDLATIAADCL